MEAQKRFEKLGYNVCFKTADSLVYRCRTDYKDYHITFHLGTMFPKTYSIDFMDWQESEGRNWIPMNERRADLKHCSTYGHWQKVDYPITIELHKAIHQQCKELGWLDEER